jgi:hypothetical protein
MTQLARAAAIATTKRVPVMDISSGESVAAGF